MLQNKLKHFDFEPVLKCDYFRQINSVYEYKQEKKAFDVNNDTRRFFYGKCRFVKISLLIRQKVRDEGTRVGQRGGNQKQ